jgi:hypothetical protein
MGERKVGEEGLCSSSEKRTGDATGGPSWECGILNGRSARFDHEKKRNVTQVLKVPSES